MLEVLTKFGAVIHVDDDSPNQKLMMDIAISAFGGAVSIEEVSQDHAEAS
jgi:hypothetical protein